VSVGKVVTKADYDSKSGDLAQQINQWAEAAANLASNVGTMTDPDLVNLGYTPDDVTLLRTCVGDMHKLAQVYLGEIDQTPAYDFRTFLNRISGLSDVGG